MLLWEGVGAVSECSYSPHRVSPRDYAGIPPKVRPRFDSSPITYSHSPYEMASLQAVKNRNEVKRVFSTFAYVTCKLNKAFFCSEQRILLISLALRLKKIHQHQHQHQRHHQLPAAHLFRLIAFLQPHQSLLELCPYLASTLESHYVHTQMWTRLCFLQILQQALTAKVPVKALIW